MIYLSGFFFCDTGGIEERKINAFGKMTFFLKGIPNRLAYLGDSHRGGGKLAPVEPQIYRVQNRGTSPWTVISENIGE